MYAPTLGEQINALIQYSAIPKIIQIYKLFFTPKDISWLQ